jgi:hypothetical protein
MGLDSRRSCPYNSHNSRDLGKALSIARNASGGAFLFLAIPNQIMDRK